MIIEGEIILDDGSKSKFLITTDGAGWRQWGADKKRMGKTVDVVEKIQNIVMEA